MSDKVEDFFAHYGVQGMHWGSRKPASAVEINARPGRKVKATGGHGQEAHPDAVKKAESGRIAKSSTTDALSTKDLQDYVNRVSLEQRYSQLNPSKVKVGHDRVKAGLAVGATVSTAYALYKSPVGKAVSDQVSKALASRV